MTMRRVPIRMKLAAALTVPLLGLLLITTIEVVDTSREVDKVRSQTALARASLGPAGVLTTLQNERTWAAIDLIGTSNMVTAPTVGYAETRAATDRAIAAFRETLSADSKSVAATYRPALDGLEALAAIRADIDASTAPRDLSNIPLADETFARYSALIRPFLDATTRVSLAIDDEELREGTALIDTTTRQIETLAELARRSILDVTLGGGINEADEISAASKLKAEFDRGNDELRRAREPYAVVIEHSFPEAMVTGFSDQIAAAVSGQPVDMAGLLAPIDVPADEGYMGFRNDLVDALNERADELNAAAVARERLYIAMAVATLVTAFALTWMVSRSITRPLRSLTDQAKQMAERRLPDAVVDILDTPAGEDVAVPLVDPVKVLTRDEVADVADALNTVQDTALDLAVEQAVLRRNISDSFVNLGRRNQSLLGRQLDFITELETNEADPDSLSNLFRLDHLATRMRRNAESLLVLAGVEPPRKWAAPVRLTDVIRAALGEVEDYQRVVVRGIEPATIVGSTAADLAHLVAELVENALVFSPPDQPVDVRGRHRHDDAPGQGAYTLAVIDSGLGMPPADVAAANRRLGGAESFTIAPSKYLGHYVAGNLAARHGIHVLLDNSPGNGITASIAIPPTLLTSEEVTSAPVTPPHGQRAVRARAGSAPSDGGASQPALPAAVQSPAATGRPPTPAAPAVPAAPVVPAPPSTPAAPAGTAAPAVPARPVVPAAPPVPATAASRGAPGDGGSPGPLWPRTLPLAALEGNGASAISRGAGPRAAGGPRPGPGAAAHASERVDQTASGLAKRTPRSGADAPSPPAPSDQALLSALGRHVRRGGDPRGVAPTSSPRHFAPPSPAYQSPPGAPPPSPGASPFSAPDSLSRRVKGAQLPPTGLVPLRGRRDESKRRSTPAAASGAPSSSAMDVHSLLTSFSAGVQRGLDEARQRSADQEPAPRRD
jgi:signal transduction histidine kinase